MENTNLTASVIMSFVEKLEQDSSTFYEKLAEKYESGKELFLKFADESSKNKTHLVRTYQETISDALEATFSFEGLELSDFDFQSILTEEGGIYEVVKKVQEIEEKISELYLRIAEQAKSLLATIPGAFKRVAKKRMARIDGLKKIIEGS